MESNITKKILKTIREGVEKNRHYTAAPMEEEEIVPKKNFITEAKELMDNASKKKINEEVMPSEKEKDALEITSKTPQFGDIYTKQSSQIKKTLDEDVEIKIFYYKDIEDLVLNGKIKSLNIAFQFRYKDPSGVGVFIWCNQCQLTDENARKIGKIRDCFLNWKTALIQDGDLLEKLKKASTKD